MNKVMLSGVVSSDVVIRTTKSGVDWFSFSLKTDRKFGGKTLFDYHNIKGFGSKIASEAAKATKGDNVNVNGAVTYSKYENKQGQTVRVCDIIVDDITVSRSDLTEDLSIPAVELEDDEMPF